MEGRQLPVAFHVTVICTQIFHAICLNWSPSQQSWELPGAREQVIMVQ